MADANITKKALASSLKELMEHEPFAKISVGEICAQCGMNRKSFYYHFEDKYSLVNWIFYTEFFETILDMEEDMNGQTFMRLLLEYFYSERRFYQNALQVRGQNSLWEYLIEVISPFLKVLGDEQFDHALDDFMITFLMDGVLCALCHWLEHGEDIPPEELLSRLGKVNRGLANQYSEKTEVEVK